MPAPTQPTWDKRPRSEWPPITEQAESSPADRKAGTAPAATPEPPSYRPEPPSYRPEPPAYTVERYVPPGPLENRPPPPRTSRKSRRWPIAFAAVVVVAICAIVVAAVSHSNSSAPGSGPSGPSAGPSSSAGQSQVADGGSAEQQGAENLSQLLSQSVSDRSSIVSAVNDVSSCGGNLSQDETTFQNAAQSRQTLLSQLSTMSDGSALPQSMMGDLTNAWKASVQADQDFAGWASDEMSNGCTKNDTSDPQYEAANGPDATATTDKQAFAQQWDQIANTYGLTAYQWNQL